MVDIKTFIQSLKLSQIRRLIHSETKPWFTLLKNEIKYPLLLLNFGYEYTDKILNNIKNPFWKDLLLSWSTFQKRIPINKFSVMQLPLWYNQSLTNTSIVNTLLYNNGIRTISDIIDNSDNIRSHENICETYKSGKWIFLQTIN